MSHAAVRAFYQALAESPQLTARYRTLTQGFFGYKPEKIVAFAAVSGHEFTARELEYIRLTNVEGGHRMSSCISVYWIVFLQQMSFWVSKSPLFFKMER